ncbi:MAG: YggS family pyridoxal phosphate-dependent enzyme [Bdellovibrionota bacterium]
MADTAVAENLAKVLLLIETSVRAAGRKPADVKLLAVTKTKPMNAVLDAFDAGQKLFGENYVQEAVEKIEQLPQAEWHLIGPLQSNKVKQIAGKVALIHTIDREKLVHEIQKSASAIGVVQDVLIQVNIGDEESKSGVSVADAPKLIESVLALQNLRLRGVMALPPLSDDEVASRKNFAQVRECHRKWSEAHFSPEMKKHFDVLSMGTSSDFGWAIQEGATLVRVGQMIFGERLYN